MNKKKRTTSTAKLLKKLNQRGVEIQAADDKSKRGYPSSEGTVKSEGLTKEEIQERGYSQLRIVITIPQGIQRPFNAQSDLHIDLDGHVMKGIGGLQIKGTPPFVEIQIVDRERFQESTSHGGFFWQSGIIFTQLLYAKTYPPIECYDCESGMRHVDLNFFCDNPECDSAAPYVRSAYLKRQAYIEKEATEKGISVDALVEQKIAEELKAKAEREAEDGMGSGIERNSDGTPADVSEGGTEGKSDSPVAESDTQT